MIEPPQVVTIVLADGERLVTVHDAPAGGAQLSQILGLVRGGAKELYRARWHPPAGDQHALEVAWQERELARWAAPLEALQDAVAEDALAEGAGHLVLVPHLPLLLEQTRWGRRLEVALEEHPRGDDPNRRWSLLRCGGQVSTWLATYLSLGRALPLPLPAEDDDDEGVLAATMLLLTPHGDVVTGNLHGALAAARLVAH